MSEPTTAAGRALLASSKNLPVHSAEGWSHLGMRDKFFLYQAAVDAVVTGEAIAAIEIEAKAAERDRLAGLVRGLRSLPPEGSRPLYVRWSTREDTITAVLALLEKQP